MSVLETLKGKLTNVQQDISASFKNLTTKSPQKRTRLISRTYGVDLDAAADLLNKFQEHWSKIHKASEDNAKRAEEVDKQIGELFARCERQNNAMNQLMSLVATLPRLLEDVNLTQQKIELLNNDMTGIDSMVQELEDVCERQELNTNKLHHEYQLSLYRQRRNVELEQVKVKLAKEHADKVSGHESKLQNMLRERQQAFEEQFAQEMEHYKLYGHTNVVKPVSPSTDRKIELADVNIEEDRSALDEFLESVEDVPDDPVCDTPGEKDDSDEEDKESKQKETAAKDGDTGSAGVAMATTDTAEAKKKKVPTATLR